MTSPTPSIAQLLQTLSEKSSEIKLHLCNKTKKPSLHDISVADDICGTGKKAVTKEYLAKSTVGLIYMIENIDFIMKPVISSDLIELVDTNASNKLFSDIQKQIDEHAKVTDTVNKTITDHKAELDHKIQELNSIVSNLSVNKTTLSSSGNCDCDFKRQGNTMVSHEVKPVDEVVENFISPEVRDGLLDFFEKEEFVSEGGRSVVKYGEKYNYTGNKQQPKAIPECILHVMDTLNQERTAGKFTANSCLVNKFEGPESTLGEHSDDEYTINPESDIFTISIGVARKITYRDLHSGQEIEHIVNPDSLYIMSRASQNFYSHRIDGDSSAAKGIRYSLTFRDVSKRFLNSSIIIGDSNIRHLYFGEGKGKFGYNMPGDKKNAMRINEINPQDCVGYKNIFVHCGVNDVKQVNADVTDCFNQLAGKLDTIKKLCPTAKVFVSPILPTKCVELNKLCMQFNKLLFAYEENVGRMTVHKFGVFCDPDYMDPVLSSNLGLYNNQRDIVHLGKDGIRLLANIFRKCADSYRRVTPNMSYASVGVQGGPRYGTRVNHRDSARNSKSRAES